MTVARKWNHQIIKFVVIRYDNFLVLALTNDETGIAPSKLVHTPKGVNGEEEGVDGIPITNLARKLGG